MAIVNLSGAGVSNVIVSTPPGVGTVNNLIADFEAAGRSVAILDATRIELVDLITLFHAPTAMLSGAEVLIVVGLDRSSSPIPSAMVELVTHRTIADVPFPNLEEIVFVVPDFKSGAVIALQDSCTIA